MKLPSISSMPGRGQGLLGLMMQQVPILQEAEFSQEASTHLITPDKSVHTGSSARAIGAPIQRDAQAPAAGVRALAVYGREISIDNVYIADRSIGRTTETLRQFSDQQLVSLAIKLADEVGVEFVAGTDADNRMLGLFEFLKDAAAGGQTAKLGFTAAEIAAMNKPAELDLASTADQNAFIELLEREMANVPGTTALICNTFLKARLATIARRVGAAGETRNSFGTPLQTFSGIPIVPVTTDAISNTQSDGAGHDVCTSLAIVRFNEATGVSIATNSGFTFQDFDLDSVKPNTLARLEAYLNLKIQKANALRRISRIKV